VAKGTLSVADLLATVNNATVAEFGEDDLFRAIQQDQAVHNILIDDMTSLLVERTTDQLRGSGAVDRMTMQELDEFGTARAQKVTAGANLGFPLKLKGLSVQWTRTAFKVMKARELLAQYQAAEAADLREVIADIKRAIFTATNSTFTDRLVDNLAIPVKALANADGFPLPVGPNGETFDAGAEDHYIGEASYTAAFLSAAINTVAKKYRQADMAVYINRAQVAATRGFTGSTTDPNFVPMVEANIRVADTREVISAPALDTGSDRNNRAIGYFDEAEVLVKPWVPANYVVIHNRSARKVLAFRERFPGSGNFGISFEDELHPLRARGLEREYGIAVQERASMAVLYIANATYASPTIAA
jgi:hypothetical protein